MNGLADFHFLRPWMLLLAPIVIGVWWFWRRQADPLRGWRSQMAPELLDALRDDEGDERRPAIPWLLIGWLLAVISISGPTWRLEPNPFAEDAPPVLIVLKSDVSMERPSPAPNRLARAQLKLTDFAHARRGQPLGLIAYAGTAHLVLPPTPDTAVVAEMATHVRPDVMPQPGDRLDLALKKAGELLEESGAGGSILIIADSIDESISSSLVEWRASTDIPVAILAVADEDTSEMISMTAAAESLNATFQRLTMDDKDVERLVMSTARRTSMGQAGESERWQEMGYWISPLVAWIVIGSFRRKQTVTQEAAS